MTKDGALEMCLEYIETNAHERRFVRWAIKEALAQPPLPEQDFKTATKEDAPLVKWAKDQTPPLPVQRLPLTEDQIKHLWETRVGQLCPSYPLEKSDWVQFARTIEAAHNIGAKP